MTKKKAPLVNIRVTRTVPGEDSTAELTVAHLRDGTAVASPVTAHITPTTPHPDYPAVELELAVLDGAVQVTRLQLKAASGQAIRSDALRGWSLPVLAGLAAEDMELIELPADEGVKYVTNVGGKLGEVVLALSGTDGKRYAFKSTDEGRRSIHAAVRQRATVDSARLAEVANAYRDGGIDGVKNTLHQSTRQAYRLVSRAREAGVL